MAQITTSITSDEKTWQNEFYTQLFGAESNDITIDRSTDGYIDKDNGLIDEKEIPVKAINSLFSDKYYDNSKYESDVYDGIASDLDGTETTDGSKKIRVPKTYNENIIGYMAADASGFDNPRLHACFTRNEKFNGNGFNVRRHNFLEKLPCFAASRYTDNYNNWKVMSMVMKSGDKAEQYLADVSTGNLDKFLCQTLIWTSFTHYAHLRSLNGSDGRYYKNELCFDNLNGKTTLAWQKLEEFKANGYKLTEEETELFNKWNDILDKICETDEYNPDFSYGLYQIDEEINIKIQQGFNPDGTPKMVTKYGDLNNLIKDMKALVKKYYLENLVDTLFEYEFLK